VILRLQLFLLSVSVKNFEKRSIFGKDMNTNLVSVRSHRTHSHMACPSRLETLLAVCGGGVV